MGISEEFGMLARAVIAGKHVEAGDLTAKLIDESVLPGEILEKGILPGMDVVGRRFRDNHIFLPQVLISARAMKTSMRILEPLMVPIIIGGAPINQKFADDIGAAGYVRNAAEAVELITKIISERKED